MKERYFSAQRLWRVFASSGFFWFIVGLFVLQAVWIAFSNRYPMAFDEDYHLGIIKLYAHHLSPFWSAQPHGTDQYGAIYRDPSYLYHYVMSFPYRLIHVFTHVQTVQVLWLRFINIALFASSLPLFRRLLKNLGVSALATNFCILLFTLIPVASLLAAQINYDNLLMPLVGLAMLWVSKLAFEAWKYRRIDGGTLLELMTLSFFASLVKYAFLPLFVGIILSLAVVWLRAFRSRRKFIKSLLFGLTIMTRSRRLILMLLLVLSAGLFVQRYGVNVWRYHTPLPNCSQVLSVQQCSLYGPWERDHLLELQQPIAHQSVAYYTWHEWLYGMWLRLFFTLDGPPTNYQTRGPLLLPAAAAIVFTGTSLVVIALYSRRLWQQYGSRFLAPLLMMALYVLSLWVDDYLAYKRTGQPVAINGRYLLPVLLPLLALAVLAWRQALSHRPRFKVVLAAVAVLCLLWGGGALTFILRSSSTWYWSNRTMRTMNEAVREVFNGIVPGEGNPDLFLR